MYERARSPTEILEDILSRYTSRTEPKEHLTKSSEIRGGFHPADLKNKLQNYKKDWLGFSKNLIPDLVEEYSYALRNEQEKAERLGEDITYPVGSVRGSFRSSERRVSDYRGTPRRDRTYDRSSRFRERSQEDDTIDKAIKLMDKIEERAGDSGETEELREELHNLKLEMLEQDNEHDLEMLRKELETVKEQQQISQRNRYDVISEAMDKLSKVLIPHLRFQNQILAKKYGLEMPQEEVPEREREEGSRGMLAGIKEEYVE